MLFLGYFSGVDGVVLYVYYQIINFNNLMNYLVKYLQTSGSGNDVCMSTEENPPPKVYTFFARVFTQRCVYFALADDALNDMMIYIYFNTKFKLAERELIFAD